MASSKARVKALMHPTPRLTSQAVETMRAAVDVVLKDVVIEAAKKHPRAVTTQHIQAVLDTTPNLDFLRGCIQAMPKKVRGMKMPKKDKVKEEEEETQEGTLDQLLQQVVGTQKDDLGDFD